MLIYSQSKDNGKGNGAEKLPLSFPFFCLINFKGMFTMKELVIIIRPEKLEKVKEILDMMHCGGMTISSVMGCGTQKGVVEENTVNVIKGFKTNINLLPKIRVEAVVKDGVVEDIITELRDKIITGHVGDGKLFIRNVEDAVRLRTGERGNKAL